MTDLSIDDVLDVESPGPPAWSGDGDYLASTVYEDDGRTLQFATADGEPLWASSNARGTPRVCGVPAISPSDARSLP